MTLRKKSLPSKEIAAAGIRKGDEIWLAHSLHVNQKRELWFTEHYILWRQNVKDLPSLCQNSYMAVVN